MIHKYLAYLKTIETGSITQAAAELGYTQSAVSRMIADLEEHWDVPLLTRNRSGIEISSEGTQLLPILQSIVKGQEELSFAVGELHGLQNGLIRVGAFTSMATGWMPLMIKSFTRSVRNRWPSSSRWPPSPVRSQPSRVSSSRVSSGSPK